MTKALENIIIVGVDPAPSKGLCVCFRDPSNNPDVQVKHYPKTDLNHFADKINDQSKNNAVLICWDAPLTVPKDQFYTRPIEAEKYEWKRWREHGASVQSFASCSHWAITQRVLGYPSLDGKPLRRALIKKSCLIANPSSKPRLSLSNPGVYVTEVHPALAMECKLNFEDFGDGGHLSGKGTYKSVAWGSANVKRENFRKLATRIMCKKADDWFPLNGKWECPVRGSQNVLDPSDFLDAWVAMDMGAKWIKGEAKIIGGLANGGFYYPSRISPSSPALLCRL